MQKCTWSCDHDSSTAAVALVAVIEGEEGGNVDGGVGTGAGTGCTCTGIGPVGIVLVWVLVYSLFDTLVFCSMIIWAGTHAGVGVAC